MRPAFENPRNLRVYTQGGRGAVNLHEAALGPLTTFLPNLTDAVKVDLWIP